MTRRTQGFTFICAGIAAAICTAWLAILAPKPMPGEFNTINHRPLWTETKR